MKVLAVRLRSWLPADNGPLEFPKKESPKKVLVYNGHWLSVLMKRQLRKVLHR